MNRDGEGYCRIHEVWERMAYGQSISSTGDNRPVVGETPFPPSGRLKSGPWSDWERQELKRYLDAGWDVQSIAERLNRSPVGIRCNIKVLRNREAEAAADKNRKKAV